MKRAHVERAEKQDFVTALRSTFQANASVIVAHYAGLTVSDMQALRKQAKQAGVSVKVDEKLVVVGGAMGATSLDPNGVKTLASMPSLDELRAKLIGLLMAPATKIAQLANAPASKLARVVAAYAEKSEAA
jgi:large subunit ribosomal protein L10